MNRLFRIVVTTFAALSSAMLLPACNTVKGAGRDIEKGAEASERAIDDATD